MIFLVAPVWMERIDECRAFLSYSAMEAYVITHAQQRKLWNADPNWCIVYGFEGDEMKHPVYQYTIKDARYLSRMPINS